MAGHFHDLKGQMNKLREKERENLTKLTIQSNDCLKELRRKAERVSGYWSNVVRNSDEKRLELSNVIQQTNIYVNSQVPAGVGLATGCHLVTQFDDVICRFPVNSPRSTLIVSVATRGRDLTYSYRY